MDKATTSTTQDIDSHFILRLPEDVGIKLKEAVLENNLDERLKIQFEQDHQRHAVVTFDDATFAAKMMDLPCMVEVTKTLDKKNFFKCGDISQVLKCDLPVADKQSESPTKSQRDEKKLQLPHGLTPPLKNVRKKRFRKTLKKKYLDAPDIDKELKRLLRADVDSIGVRWEIITADEVKTVAKVENQSESNLDASFDPSLTVGESLASLVEATVLVGTEADKTASNIEHDVFGEDVAISSSDNDSDDEGHQMALELMSSAFVVPTSSSETVEQDLNIDNDDGGVINDDDGDVINDDDGDVINDADDNVQSVE